MATRDGRWRVEVGGTGPAVVGYRLVDAAVDRWLPLTPALIAELEQHGVDLADLSETAVPGTTPGTSGTAA